VSCTCGPPRWSTGGRHLSGGRCLRQPASAGRCKHPVPREPRRLFSASAESTQKGGFVAVIEASAPISASRKRPFPGFGSGSGEARCDVVRAYAVTRDCVPCQTPALPTSDTPCWTAASANVGHTVSDRGFGLRPTQRVRLRLRPTSSTPCQTAASVYVRHSVLDCGFGQHRAHRVRPRLSPTSDAAC